MLDGFASPFGRRIEDEGFLRLQNPNLTCLPSRGEALCDLSSVPLSVVSWSRSLHAPCADTRY